MTKKNTVKTPKKLTKEDYVFPKDMDEPWINQFMKMGSVDKGKVMSVLGITLKNAPKDPKIKPETNGSVTISYLTDGCGVPRKLNIHGYRVADTRSPNISIAILDEKNKYLASVILHPSEGELLPLFEQINNLM